MNKAWALLKDTELFEGCPMSVIEETEAHFGFDFPVTYVEFVLHVNGYDGEVGANGWIMAYKLEALKEINKDYELLMEQIPDYFLFGKDAADTGYAFHKKNKTFHSFGLMSDFRRDNIEFCGNSFEEFLMYVSQC